MQPATGVRQWRAGHGRHRPPVHWRASLECRGALDSRAGFQADGVCRLESSVMEVSGISTSVERGSVGDRPAQVNAMAALQRQSKHPAEVVVSRVGAFPPQPPRQRGRKTEVDRKRRDWMREGSTAAASPHARHNAGRWIHGSVEMRPWMQLPTTGHCAFQQCDITPLSRLAVDTPPVIRGSLCGVCCCLEQPEPTTSRCAG